MVGAQPPRFPVPLVQRLPGTISQGHLRAQGHLGLPGVCCMSRQLPLSSGPRFPHLH